MFRRYRWFGLALIPLAMIGLIGSAWARGGWHRDPEKVRKFIEFRVNDVLEEAKVDEKKRKEILSILGGLTSDASAAFADHRVVRQELVGEWKRDKPDTARLHELIDERAAQMLQLAHKALDAGLAVHGKLTPEQREEVLEEVQSFHGPGGMR